MTKAMRLAIGLLLTAWAWRAAVPARADGLGEDQALAIISRNAPTIAEAIRADASLKAEIGPDKFPRALAQLARFTQSKDPDCQEALRIIGDTVSRAKAPVGKISVDGDPTEWAQALPPPDYAHVGQGTQEPAAEPWLKGFAAVVRNGHLYLMADVGGAAYFQNPEAELRVSVDCLDRPAWDGVLTITCHDGLWAGTWIEAGHENAPEKPLTGITAATGKVAELCIDTRDFAPPSKSKPIWTLWVKARRPLDGSTDLAKVNAGGRPEPVEGRKSNQGVQWSRSRYLPIFNESARPGVAAGPCVRSFLLLCADASLEGGGDEEEPPLARRKVPLAPRIAAAIAIMSATMYQCSDEEVRRKLRADNAAFLALAREIIQWQSDTHSQYRLADCPLEAQLVWANRCHINSTFFASGKDAKASLNDRENYFWASTSVDTLRELKAVALQEGLVAPSFSETAGKVDEWVRKKQTYSLPPSWYERRIKTAHDPKELQRLKRGLEVAQQREKTADVVGQFRGKPVSEFRIHHSATMLGQIQKRGRTLGTCGQHTFLCRDILRAVGIPVLTFGVEPSRSDKIDHVWPACYDQEKHCWRSYQAGRKGAEWWYFYVARVPVYTFAATAPRLSFTKSYQGPRALPYIFSRELQGSKVKDLAQQGLEEATIRQWLLTPCF